MSSSIVPRLMIAHGNMSSIPFLFIADIDYDRLAAV